MSSNTVTQDNRVNNPYRWVMLLFATLTPMLVVTLPNMSLPPLFIEISRDLDMSLVEVGWAWGMTSFTAIIFGFLGGTLGDKLGTRTTLFLSCVLTGIFGAIRSLSVDFNTLLLTTLLFGLTQPAIAINVHKLIGEWFPKEQLGMANGLVSSGFATGLMLGPLISTGLLSPMLSGWRNVLIFYGIIAIVMGILWLIVHPKEETDETTQANRASLSESFGHVIRLKNVWLIGLAALGIRACILGFSGYLPTYLREIGWSALDADRTLSLFFGMSLLGVIPLTMLSDKLSIRREFLIIASLVMGLGIGSLGFTQGIWVVVAVMISGVVFDAFMAIYITAVMEVKGVGLLYSGTALGFAGMIRNLGGTFSPPIGNSLVVYGSNIPFIFWGTMGLIAAVGFMLLSSHKKNKRDNV